MYPHLAMKIREQVHLPLEERIAIIRRDRWIGTTAAQTVLSMLQTLVEAPEKIRMQGLVAVGPYNNGKSMAIERFRQAFGGDPSKVLVVESPATGGLARIYSAILRALNAPFARSQSLTSLEHQMHTVLRVVRPKVLVFDDFQHVVRSGRSQLHRAFSFFRSLGYEYRTSIVLVGDLDVLLSVRSDEQMASRLKEAYLPRWEYDEDWLGLLASLESVLPLKERSSFASPDIARDVFKLSQGLIGEAVELLTQAAVLALKQGGECVTPQIIKDLGYVPLSGRGKQIDTARLV